MPPRAEQTRKTNFDKITNFYESQVYSQRQNIYPNKYIFDSLEDSAIQQINGNELIKSLLASGSARAYQVALILAANHVNFSNKNPLQAYLESKARQDRLGKGEEIGDELNFIIQCKKIELYLQEKQFGSAKSELAKLVIISAKIQRSNLEPRRAGRYTEYFTAFSKHVNGQITAMTKRIRAQKEYEIFQYQESKPRIFGRYEAFLGAETIKNNNLLPLALNPQFDLLNFLAPDGGGPIYQQMLQVTDDEIIEVDGASYKKLSSSRPNASFCRFVSDSGEIIFRENGEDGTSQVFCFGAGQREFVQKIAAEVRRLSPAPAPAQLLDLDLYQALDAFLTSGQGSSITIGEETWQVESFNHEQKGPAIRMFLTKDKQLAVLESDGRIIKNGFAAEGELARFLGLVKEQCSQASSAVLTAGEEEDSYDLPGDAIGGFKFEKDGWRVDLVKQGDNILARIFKDGKLTQYQMPSDVSFDSIVQDLFDFSQNEVTYDSARLKLAPGDPTYDIPQRPPRGNATAQMSAGDRHYVAPSREQPAIYDMQRKLTQGRRSQLQDALSHQLGTEEFKGAFRSYILSCTNGIKDSFNTDAGQQAIKTKFFEDLQVLYPDQTADAKSAQLLREADELIKDIFAAIDRNKGSVEFGAAVKFERAKAELAYKVNKREDYIFAARDVIKCYVDLFPDAKAETGQLTAPATSEIQEIFMSCGVPADGLPGLISSYNKLRTVTATDPAQAQKERRAGQQRIKDAQMKEIQEKWFSWPHFVRLQKIEDLGLDAANKASITANLIDSGDLLSPGKIVQYLNENVDFTAGESYFESPGGGGVVTPGGLDDQLLNDLVTAYDPANTDGDDSQKFNQLNSAISDFYCQFIAKLPEGFVEDETPKQIWQLINQYCRSQGVDDPRILKELQMFHLNISSMVVAQMGFAHDVTPQDQNKYIADSVQLFTMIQRATIDPNAFDSSARLPDDKVSFYSEDVGYYIGAEGFFAKMQQRLGFDIAQVRLPEDPAHVPGGVDPQILPVEDPGQNSLIDGGGLSRSPSQSSLSSSSSEEVSTSPPPADGNRVRFADEVREPTTPAHQYNPLSKLGGIVPTPNHPSGAGKVADEVVPPLQFDITDDKIARTLQYLSDENSGRKRIERSKAGIFASEGVKTAVADIVDKDDFSGNLDISLLTVDNREISLLAQFQAPSVEIEPMSQYDAIIQNTQANEGLRQFGMTALAYNLLLDVRNLMLLVSQEKIDSVLASPMFPGPTDEELTSQFEEEFGTSEEDGLSTGSLALEEEDSVHDFSVQDYEKCLHNAVAELQQVMNFLDASYSLGADEASPANQEFARDAEDLPNYIQRAGDFVKAQIKSPAFQVSKQSFLDYKGQKEAELVTPLDLDEEVTGLVEDPTATELSDADNNYLTQALPHLLKYLTTSKHLEPLQNNSVLGDGDKRVMLSIVKKGRFTRSSSEKAIFFNQLIESSDNPDYNNVAKTYNTLLQIASYAQNEDPHFSELYNPNELVASLRQSLSQLPGKGIEEGLPIDELITKTTAALKIKVKSEKFKSSMRAAENAQLGFNTRVNAEIGAAEFLVKSNSKSSALDETNPNSFMQSLDENRVNPAPKTPYRGIGVKSDLVMLGAPEDTRYALQISDVFSTDEDPWNKRFSGVDNVDELKGALITQVKIGDSFVAISDFVKLDNIPGSLAAIAQLFHVQNNVEFKIISKGGEEKEVACDNRLNKTAIYAPTPSGNDAVAGETSDFRALSQMLDREGYQGHAEQVIRGCVARQMIAKQQEEELRRQPSRSPSPSVMSQSQKPLSSDYYYEQVSSV